MDEKPAKQRKSTDADASIAAPDEKAGAKDRGKPSGGAASAGGINPLENLMLRREVRIGMAVLAVLVLALGYLFVSKINEPDEGQTPVADAAETEHGDEPHSPASSPPPTVVTASASDNSHAAPGVAPGPPDSVYVHDVPRHDAAPPNPSYLPRRNAPVDGPVDGSAEATTASDAERVAMDELPHAADAGHAADAPSVTANAIADDGSKYGRYADEAPSHATPRTTPHLPETSETPETPDGNVASNAPAAVAPGVVAPGVVADAVETRGEEQADASSTADASETTKLVDPVEAHVPDTIADAGSVMSERKDPVEPSRPGTEAPSVATVRNRTYVTVEGDTPASIAAAYFEDARFAAALMAYNGVEIAPDVALTPGGEVLIPSQTVLEREFATLVPSAAAGRDAGNIADARPSAVGPDRVVGPARDAQRSPVSPSTVGDASRDAQARPRATRVYTVARGETVYDIARRELGRVARWREILELNAEQLGGDIDAVEPGMKLVLPDEGRSNVARQRGELIWR